MSKFKAGDVVGCRLGAEYSTEPRVGGAYKVVEASVHGTVMLRGVSGWWGEDRFVLAGQNTWEQEVLAAPPAFDDSLTGHLYGIQAMMQERHQKYGPGNIAKHGDLGILVRMGDKFARLENGQKSFSDETVNNTLDDIIGYALIWKMWLDGTWPGSPNSIGNEIAKPDSSA